jgi:hypothetical protein
MKLCKDCKWISRTHENELFMYAKCDNPKTKTIDPVSGETKVYNCNTERASFTSSSCGPDGKHWEAKS